MTIATDGASTPGELSLLRETVVVELGDVHLDDLLTIADPLVVTDLPTLLWSPHGHHEVVSELLPLSQAVLLDSVEEPTPREALDWASQLREQAYVVDLAWLRSDALARAGGRELRPAGLRRELRTITSLTVRHHPASTAAALLLTGLARLAARLAAKPPCWPTGGRCGAAPTRTGRTSPCTCRPPPS